ncbi:MAG: pyrroloquinoline quinone biosynthesis protein PqqB [Planctomycetes bacterium]|nr:pyrroloquinoline quinone biosynthesis protein PqqB [Planctomycetota bacterium]
MVTDAPKVNCIEILGVAQDGGRPHLNCEKSCCANVDDEKLVAALAVHGADEQWVLIDASPDMAQQIRNVGSMPSAIVLTHAHIGHYTGLTHLGREVMSADNLAVWCSASMADFLRANGPWSQLVELQNIRLYEFKSGGAFSPIPGVKMIPLKVPHRDEYSDTHGFSISMNSRRTLYIPDIDSWSAWGDLATFARAHENLIIDATFYDDDELGGRDMSMIPHPRVKESLEILAPIIRDTGLRVIFTHLNHTNPLWNVGSVAYENVSSQHAEVAKRGLIVQ